MKQQLEAMRSAPRRAAAAGALHGDQPGDGFAEGKQPAPYVAFVEEMKASGFVAQALERHAIQGAAVAPKGPAQQ